MTDQLGLGPAGSLKHVGREQKRSRGRRALRAGQRLGGRDVSIVGGLEMMVSSSCMELLPGASWLA